MKIKSSDGFNFIKGESGLLLMLLFRLEYLKSSLAKRITAVDDIASLKA